MNKTDVTALGELLIDFTQNGVSEQGNPLFEANPGGAPCNVLAMLTKLGNSTAFIGKVGKDNFGSMLKKKVSELGINTQYLYEDEEVNTTLAFVHTQQDGDRDFSFYRNPGADMMLTETEIVPSIIENSRIFHFGTISMTHETVRKATKKAIEIAKRSDIMVSFDPNIREPLWVSLDEAKKQVEYGLQFCDILKISDNEIQWLTGEKDYTRGVLKIRQMYEIPLIVVSMGSKGSRAYYQDKIVEAAPILRSDTIETTGAGDTFGACILDYILKHGMNQLTETNLNEMLLFANAAASIITTRRGALCVMPSKKEVLEQMNEENDAKYPIASS